MKRFTGIILVVLLIAAVVIAQPATGQDRTEERLTALETRVADLEAIVHGGTQLEPSEQASVETYDLTGTFTIIGRSTRASNGNIKRLAVDACEGQGGFSDVVEGLSVVVRDQQGITIATGRLGPGAPDPEFESVTCIFPFTVFNLPERSFYEIEIGHRGAISYSFEELDARGWHVDFTLSSP